MRISRIAIAAGWSGMLGNAKGEQLELCDAWWRKWSHTSPAVQSFARPIALAGNVLRLSCQRNAQVRNVPGPTKACTEPCRGLKSGGELFYVVKTGVDEGKGIRR